MAQPQDLGGWRETRGGVLARPDTVEAVELRRQLEEERRGRLRAELQARGRFFDQYAFWTGYPVPGAHAKRGRYTYEELRRAAEESPVDSAIILRRLIAIRYYWKRARFNAEGFGWKVIPVDHLDPRKDLPTEMDDRCRRAEDMLERVSLAKYMGALPSYVSEIVREELTLDHKCVEVLVDRWGRPTTRHAVDGATIYPILHVLVPHMRQMGLPNTWDGRRIASESLSEQHGVDITNAAYIQVVEGRIVAGWRAEPARGEGCYLAVHITNPHPSINRALHGYSILEQSIDATDFFVASWQYNRSQIDLNYPEKLLVIRGEYDKQGLTNFNAQINSLTGGSAPAGQLRVPILTGPAAEKGEEGSEGLDVEVKDLRASPKDLSHPELMRLLVPLKCSYYGMHPSSINFSIDRGSGGPRLGNQNESAIFAQANEEGMWGLMDNIAAFETMGILRYYDSSLRIVVVRKPTDSEAIEIAGKRLGACWTMDEVRKQNGLPLLGPDKGGDVIPNVAFNSALQQRRMADQMGQQAQGAPQGPGGPEEAPNPMPGQGPQPGARPAPRGPDQNAAPDEDGAPGPVRPDGLPMSDDGRVDWRQLGIGPAEETAPPDRQDVLAALLGRGRSRGMRDSFTRSVNGISDLNRNGHPSQPEDEDA